MDKNYRIEGEKLLYLVPQELDHHCSIQLSYQLDALIDTYQIRKLIFDFSNTEFMDSSGIGVVIGRSRKLHYYGGEMEAVNMSDRVEKIFRTAGLFRIVKVNNENGEVVVNG